MDSNLVKRIAVALVGIPVAFGLVWQGGWTLAALVAAIGVLGCGELFTIAAAKEIRPLRRTGMALAGVIPLGVQYCVALPGGLGRLGLATVACFPLMVILVLSVALVRRGVGERPLAASAVTLFGVIYTAVLPATLLIIRGAYPARNWGGVALVFFPLVVTWICDTAAMFGGRAFGRHKLAPAISPGKTREGGIAGVVGGMLTAAVFALWIFPRFEARDYGIPVDLLPVLVIGLVLSVMGQLGDLVESLFKREAGVKDSSALIPGHGGVLDRFDSLYFVLPIATFCYLALGVI